MKEILRIKGGNVLSGEVSIGGAKNSLVALIPASIITKSIVKIVNVKPIDDTYTLIKILEKLNVGVLYDDKDCMYIDARNVKNVKLDIDEIMQMRASYYFMGALLSLYNKASVMGPGGCNFGERPIDLHLYAFECLGIKYEVINNVYNFYKDGIIKEKIDFVKKSVGATINAILASCRIKKTILIKNCSLEPEVDDLIMFMNKCGANIYRDKDDIVVKGVSKLHGCEHCVMSDRIEAGTFMIIGGVLGNNVKIKNIEVEYLKKLVDVLKNIGVKIIENKDHVIVSKGVNYKPVNVVVEPYPGFPTDLQQPLTVLLSLCDGVSSIKETIYPARLSHVDSLNAMNANIVIDGDLIVIDGNRKFIGGNVSGKDLRGGISLVVASLLANDDSRIDGVKYIKRGYSDLVFKLKKLGANIELERVEEIEE